MGPIEAITTCFRKYVTFSGRASRAEFWWFALFFILVDYGLSQLDKALFTYPVIDLPYITMSGANMTFTLSLGSGFFSPIWSFLILLPFLAVGWRRMQDAGRPGYWFALLPVCLTVIVGAVFLLATIGATILAHFLLKSSFLILIGAFVTTLINLLGSSQQKTNKYGPNPSEVTS
ncbi:Inner membrane protein YhaH [Roseovarius albus]|uniref:Inner membrane protein YhaH n=1 Tax=Roseovarius albus TaxID=1247867 RepID=A0A1X6YRI7_9RHOB|nr:DUF805 domain-containing protein [Roseovarius albus]SLN29185.1 Inner membrane protein YhaH [Roseovarius albus]